MTVARVTKALSRLRHQVLSGNTLRAIVSIMVFLVLWEAGSRSKEWLGVALPWIGIVPAPSAVATAWAALIGDPGYWLSWYQSAVRVFSGFIAAMIIGIPLGLLIAVNTTFRGMFFPVFETLRPIPPLAWVPASIIFWPTQELSIMFVTFLGAFYTVVINVIGGARAIDARYIQVALSLGYSRWAIFRRVVFPSTVPSIVVGAAVGMGITWEVVVAAEMISGGGDSAGGAGGGLGFFIWNSYNGGNYAAIVVGMISIGIAGYISSGILRRFGGLFTPWLRGR